MTRTRYNHDPDDLHPCGTYSRLWHDGPWGLQRAEGLQSCLWMLSRSIRLPDESWNSANSVRSVSPLPWRYVLPEVPSNLSSSMPSASPRLLNIGSSLWASVQSETCICTSVQPAVTHTSCSKQWSLSTTTGSWTSAQCTDPIATPSRVDLTEFGSSWVKTQLSTSATVLSHPFWYSNSKLNCARAPIHQWPIASRLGVIII